MINKTKEDIINKLKEQMRIVKMYVKQEDLSKRIRDNEMFNRGYMSAYIDEGIINLNDLNVMLLKLK